MTNKPFHFFVYFVFLANCPIAFADLGVSIRGFGSAAAQKVGTKMNIPDLGNTGSKVDFIQLSRIGVNMLAQIDDKFSASTQFLASGGGEEFKVALDWGFVSWRPNGATAIRAGRLVSPVWLYSQQIDAGYTYPWVKLPEEVYGLNPMKNINGISILGERRIGRGVLQGEILGGSSRSTFSQITKGSEAEYDIRLTSFVGGDLRFVLDDFLTLRAAYSQAELNGELDSRLRLPAGTITGVTVPTYLFVPTILDANRAKFFSLGLKAEYNGFFLISEFAKRRVAGAALTRASGFYGTLGRTFGLFTPYAMYSWRGKMAGTLRLHPQYPTVTSLLEKMVSWGGGINFQVHENVILKAEVLHSAYKFQDSSRSFDFNHYLASADFIF